LQNLVLDGIDGALINWIQLGKTQVKKIISFARISGNKQGVPCS